MDSELILRDCLALFGTPKFEKALLDDLREFKDDLPLLDWCDNGGSPSEDHEVYINSGMSAGTTSIHSAI